MDPLEHFLNHGVHEFRDPNALFDTQWYLAAYPDVAQAGTPPVLHYLLNGAAELRDPGPLFSTREYLETFPWLTRAGINPLVHRILSGFVAPRRRARLIGSGDYAGSPVRKTTVDVVDATISAFEDIEPDLAALKAHRLQDFPVIARLGPPCERAWAELYRTLTAPPRRVIFVAGLTEPDPAVISLIDAVKKSGLLAETLILSTDEVTRPAPTWLPREAQWRAYSDLGVQLGPEERAFLTTTFLHSLRPAQAMLVGSRAAWDSLLTHGAALAQLTIFFGWAPSGLRSASSLTGDLRTHFRTCLPYLRALYLEDERLAEELVERYGLPPEDRARLITLRRPWVAEEDHPDAAAPVRPHGSQRRIMWAGNPDERAEASLRNAFAQFGGDLELDLWRTYLPAIPVLDSEVDTIADFDCVLLTAAPESGADVLLDAASAGVPLLHLGEGELGIGVKPQEIDVDALFTRDGVVRPLADLSVRAVRRLRRLVGSEAERRVQLQRLKAYVAARHRPDQFMSTLTGDGGFLAAPAGRMENRP